MPSAVLAHAPLALTERLTGRDVLDPAGRKVDPGDALPLPAQHAVPTMLVPRELNYLHWLGHRLPAGGRAVELGCFFGGSTAAIVEGMRASGRDYPPVLVYDGFIAPDSEEIVNSWWMRSYGLKAGENFRARYEALHASRLDRIAIREGWLPENIDRAGERRVYPEQAPIDLLFIDAAKSWGVHLTILRAFARHMKIGSVLVQQDFLDVPTFWLPLHMWQLRDVFRPLDVVRGASSVSFECVADPSERVDHAWPGIAFTDAASADEIWREVEAYWGGLIGPEAAGFVHGHAARHASFLRDPGLLIRRARAYEAWAASRSSMGMYMAPVWGEFLLALAGSGHASGPNDRALRDLVAESCVRRELPRRDRAGCDDNCVSPAQRTGIWRGVIERLRRASHTRIALYGAGSHTHWLLRNAWNAPDITIAAVIDDAPPSSEIAGIPVVTPANAGPLLRGVTAVLPSSDAHEAPILKRAAALYGGSTSISVLGVYTEPTAEATPEDPAPGDSAAVVTRADIGTLERIAPHRSALGLPPERAWLGEFVRRAGVPGWARHDATDQELLFLWDAVEAVRPDIIVEIGTASGITASTLAAAGEFFGGMRTDRPSVHTFEVDAFCSYGPARRVGAAVRECVPLLADRVHIKPGRTAIDAARCFSVGSVDLALIDGDRRHPTPTLDVLALLYVLRPGAWVILRDVERAAATKVHRSTHRELATGTETLFKRWPFGTIQPQFAETSVNSIGAVRLPDNPADAVAFLLDHLELPWETGRGMDPNIASALALRRPRG